MRQGGTIGIMGGGQLGRMTALAAANLGFSCHIYSDVPDSPAAKVAQHSTVAAYDDHQALTAFASAVDVVTFEFENIPASSVKTLAAFVPVRPNAESLHVAQNRCREKALAAKLGFATAPYREVESQTDLVSAYREIGQQGALLKTVELGYDGKGQYRLRQENDCAAAWAALGQQKVILEGFVAFEREISVVVARSADGHVLAYEPAENTHENGILRKSAVPAHIPQELADVAQYIAIQMAEALDLVGLLAVEFFVTPKGELLVNEMAPRPHNSGHWTMDAAVTSQFEQLVRAVTGLPLGNPKRRCDVEMYNLLGNEISHWLADLAKPNLKLHLYGKEVAAPGRKMGHVNLLSL